MAKSPRLAEHPRSVLPGSEKAAVASTPEQQPAQKATAGSSKLTVSVIVKRISPIKSKRLGKDRVTRKEFLKLHAADPDAVKLVKKFAKEFNLSVEPDPKSVARRTLQLTGTASDMQQAFGVKLMQKTIEGKKYRVREGSITLPKPLIGAVTAVLGLDNRPQARPHFRVHASPSATSVSYTPVQVAEAYQFPANASGAGQTIGIIELGGGFRQADLNAYFATLGQTAPTPVVVSVDGGKNAPSTSDSADGEVMLDIEVAAAVAPGAKIAVYFAPNTDQGFIDAITTAVHDTTNKPSVISISWGGPESSWTAQSLAALDAACQSAAALGITITVAAGDNGSSDGVTDGSNNVDFPASSPNVLACGGTTLEATGRTIASEVVWNENANNEGATGGGVSNVFPLPSWQANSNVPAPTLAAGGRGVPDVAGDADPVTGYTIRVDGSTGTIGGTSAVAPLWAGLIAVLNQQTGTTAGFINPTIYAAKAANCFNDITSGNNGAFSAGPGWDACTGLGSPIGTALLKLFGGPSSIARADPNPNSGTPRPQPSRPQTHPHSKAAQTQATQKAQETEALGPTARLIPPWGEARGKPRRHTRALKARPIHTPHHEMGSANPLPRSARTGPAPIRALLLIPHTVDSIPMCGIFAVRRLVVARHPGGTDMAAQQLVKASMSLPKESVEIVRELADEAGTSMAEIVRRAIEIQKLLRDTTKQGGRILLKDRNRSTSELILL